MSYIYLVGSLREGRVREVARVLRKAGHKVFDDWHACHPDADEAWREYEQSRGRTYAQALDGKFLRHCFEFDYEHLKKAEVVILVAKPGKIGGFSAAVELTWAKCQGKDTCILLDGEPERWEMMALLCAAPSDIYYDLNHLVEDLK
jgi:hypothetical protein